MVLLMSTLNMFSFFLWRNKASHIEFCFCFKASEHMVTQTNLGFLDLANMSCIKRKVSSDFNPCHAE